MTDKKETELQGALRRLSENDDFRTIIDDMKNRRSDIIMRSEMDSIMRDHPSLIACTQYGKCLGELIHLFESAGY